MKGTSKVIMGATLVMVVSLAIVLGLILVLLAELYCSLLLRRRQLLIPTAAPAATPITTTNTTTISSSKPPQPQDQSAPPPGPPLNSFYAQGVLRAPRNFLFPAVSSKEDHVDIEKQHSQIRQILESQTEKSKTSPCRIGLLSPSPPSPSITPITSPQPIQQASLQASSSGCKDGVSGGDGEHFVYISNPIYDNDARPSRVDTPFETPDTSPSRLEMSGSSGDDEEEIAQPTSSMHSSLPVTPPLSPMKKLPAKACSVSLRDARSLGTSGSDSNSNNGLSSSSSGSPCTSPSW
ncbi:hypothetical protein L1049_001299 [Liquidambar formosana]|uniref:Uncharacterized protein n=1 Tax=Liquidambar formosana TaxID=63359 RepID=A0AAP0NAC6_LIQFO